MSFRGQCQYNVCTNPNPCFQVKYLNKHIHMYNKYGLPIWLTEFACGFEASQLTAEGQASAPENDN